MATAFRRPLVRPLAPPPPVEDPEAAKAATEAQRSWRLQANIARSKFGGVWNQILVPSFHAGSMDEL